MQGSQLPHPHSHWMHMAPIKVMFHQRSLFHLYSLLRLRNCSFSIGRVWIQDFIEALVTAIHEEVCLNAPSKEAKSLHMSQLQLLWVGTRWNLGTNKALE